LSSSLSRNPGLQRIVSSGYSAKVGGLAEGNPTAVFYLPKSCPADVLLSKVGECLPLIANGEKPLWNCRRLGAIYKLWNAGGDVSGIADNLRSKPFLQRVLVFSLSYGMKNR